MSMTGCCSCARISVAECPLMMSPSPVRFDPVDGMLPMSLRLVVVNIDEILAALTLDEKVALTHGEDLWSTYAIQRAGIPKIVVTDGPNGARGPIDPERSSTASICVPCGSSLGATWDPALVEQVGALIG